MVMARYVVVLVIICFNGEAAKNKKLLDTINVCNRNDPEVAKCFCANFNKVLPLVKDGAPEMNIIPIEPILVENLKIDLLKARSMNLQVNVLNVVLNGLSKGHLSKCSALKSSNGIQFNLTLNFPEIELKAEYQAVGNLLLIGIDSRGDFRALCTELELETIWNPTLVVKNNQTYMIYTGDFVNMAIEKLVIFTSKLFGNNTELNDNINRVINENIKTIYEEVKPTILASIQKITKKIIDDFYATFPYDMLYPNE